LEEKLKSELKEEIKKELKEEQRINKNEVNLISSPINLRNTSFDFGFSLIIAVGLMAISIIIGGIVFGSFDKSNIFVLELGFPFGWFKISNTDIGVSNWLNLFVDFIFYILISFGLFLGYEYYKTRKTRNLK
ncbi:MAG: hypothetical protein ACQXXF_07855, partial [Thermoplasmatota archaeon]